MMLASLEGAADSGEAAMIGTYDADADNEDEKGARARSSIMRRRLRSASSCCTAIILSLLLLLLPVSNDDDGSSGSAASKDSRWNASSGSAVTTRAARITFEGRGGGR